MKIFSLTLTFTLIYALSYADGDYCFNEAGTRYNIAPELLWAIANHESGFKPDAINWNKNGSFDVGTMQVNSAWAKTLGEDYWQRMFDPCENIMAGAWVLRQCINSAGYNWGAVGCYNTGSSRKGQSYINKIVKVLEKARLLESIASVK